MSMLLTSGGVREGPVLQALQGLLGGPPTGARAVVVLDAILPFPGDKGTLLAHLEAFRALGWAECDLLTLASGPRSLVESRLRSADVVLGYGGSNHWQAHAWTSTGLAPVLADVVRDQVYVGWSAGSMIFSRAHAAAVDAMEDRDEVEMLQLDAVGPALPLFDWLFVGHLGAPYLPHMTDAWAERTAARLGAPVWFLDDESALVLRDPDDEPEPVSGGHWLRYDGDGRLVASDAGSARR